MSICHFRSSDPCITDGSSADEDSVPPSTTKVSVLIESDADSKMNILVDTPYEYEQHVEASFLTGSDVETKNAYFTSSENGI